MPSFSSRSKISRVLAHSFLSEYHGILQSVHSQTSLFPGTSSVTVKSKKESPVIFTVNVSFCFSELPLKVTPHQPGTLLIFLIASCRLIAAEVLLLKSMFFILLFLAKLGYGQAEVLYKSEISFDNVCWRVHLCCSEDRWVSNR